MRINYCVQLSLPLFVVGVAIHAEGALPYPVYPGSVIVSEDAQPTRGVYETASLPAEVRGFYSTALGESGWRVVSEEPRVSSVLFGKDQEHISLTVVRKDDQSGSYILVSHWEGELPAPREPGEDAAGFDFEDVPRIPKAVRLISQPLASHGSNVVYEVDRFQDAVEEFYRREMPRSGWHLIRSLEPSSWREYARALKMQEGGAMWVFQKGESREYCLIGILPAIQRPDKTLLSVIRMEIPTS